MLKSKKQTRCYPVRMGAVGFFIQKFYPRILTKTICKISYLPTKFFRLFTHIIHKLIDKCYSDLFHLGFWGWETLPTRIFLAKSICRFVSELSIIIY